MVELFRLELSPSGRRETKGTLSTKIRAKFCVHLFSGGSQVPRTGVGQLWLKEKLQPASRFYAAHIDRMVSTFLNGWKKSKENNISWHVKHLKFWEHKWCVTVAQPCPFISVLSTTVFVLQGKSGVVSVEIVWQLAPCPQAKNNYYLTFYREKKKKSAPGLEQYLSFTFFKARYINI